MFPYNIKRACFQTPLSRYRQAPVWERKEYAPARGISLYTRSHLLKFGGFRQERGIKIRTVFSYSELTNLLPVEKEILTLLCIDGMVITFPID